MKNQINVRNSSIELIKSIAVIGIVFSSAAPYGATFSGGYSSFINLKIPEPTIQYIFFLLCRWFGQIGDTLFIASSAWFLCESKKTHREKVVFLVLASLVYSIIGLILALPWYKPTIHEVIASLLPITFKRNWFVGCYILYYVLHPYINKALADISQKQLSLIAIILFVLYSIIPQIGSYYYFNDLIAFISIHIFVMYFKRHISSKLKYSTKRNLTISCMALILAWIVGLSIIGSKLSFMNGYGLLFCHYYNPVIILLSLCVISIASQKTWYSKPINKFSSISLLVYLTHGSYFWLTYGKYKTYDLFSSANIPPIATCFILIMMYIVTSILCMYIVTSILCAYIFNLSFAKLVPIINDKLLPQSE